MSRLVGCRALRFFAWQALFLECVIEFLQGLIQPVSKILDILDSDYNTAPIDQVHSQPRTYRQFQHYQVGDLCEMEGFNSRPPVNNHQSISVYEVLFRIGKPVVSGKQQANDKYNRTATTNQRYKTNHDPE